MLRCSHNSMRARPYGTVEPTVFRKITSICIAYTALVVLSFNAFAENVTLQFKGADIQAVINSVAEITGKNFIVDPRVKGKVTVISSRPMNTKEIYQVFLTILDVHGYAAVPSGKVIKILPDADAKHSGIPASTDEKLEEGDESITRVVEVQHVAAAQLVPILRPLVPPQGHLAAYPESNMLIIADRANNIQRLLKIIERIDQPSSGEIEIVRLEYAAAGDLVRVLTTLQQQTTQGKQQADRATLVADERTNSILIGGDRSDRLQLRAIISHLDTPAEVEGDTHVVYLRYANAKDLVPVLTGVADTTKNTAAATGGVPGAAPKPPVATAGGARGQNPLLDIQADESSNALVITAPPGLYRSLESVIRQLDVRRAQVLVEAIIAEVSSEREAQLGIQWIFDGHKSDNPVGIINFGSPSITSIASSILSAREGNVNLATLGDPFGTGAAVGFGRFNSDSFNFGALVRALQGDGNTNILSTPTLMTMDNEEADIFIGQEVSIPSGSFTNTGGGTTPSNPFTTFDRVPVGISLKVKPQINEGDTVRLDIKQSVDNILAGSAGAGDVVTSNREINTTVMVDNGKTLVLGGLIKDDLVENDQRVPLLGDIPLVGALFRYKSVKKVKTNLMVFLRPVILRDERTGTMLTNSKYNYIRDLQLMRNEKGVSLLFDESTPMLPDSESFIELPPPFEEKGSQDSGNAPDFQYDIQKQKAEQFPKPAVSGSE